VIVEGFDIFPGLSQSATTIDFISGYALFDNCTVESSCRPPIITHDSGSIYFKGCTVTSVEAAIAFPDSDVTIDFQDCKISAPVSVGIVASGKSKVQLGGTVLSGCGDSGLLIRHEASLFVVDSEISGNEGDAIEFTSKNTTSILKGTTIKKHFNGAALNGYGQGGLKIESCVIDGCIAGVLASKGFVITSKDSQYRNASQSALLSASEGSTITMSGDLLSNEGLPATPEPQQEEEEDQEEAPPWCRLGINSDTKSTVTCEGVKITHLSQTGCAVTGDSVLTFVGCSFENIGECAIEAHDGARLELTDCHFESIGCIGALIQQGVDGFVKNTKVTGCEIVGVHYIDNQTDFYFEGCEFSNNPGTGVNLRGVPVTFTNCQFVGNSGPGVEIRGEGTTPRFDSCTFEGNHLGVSLSEGAAPVFVKTLFKANQDAGIELSGARGQFEECTIEANVEGGIFANEQSVATFTNCSILSNLKVGAQAENEGTEITFESCDIALQGGTPGVGVNIASAAVMRFSKCSLHENAGIQVQIRDKGQAFLTACDIYKSSQVGVGINVEQGGVVEVLDSNLYEETQGSIIIGADGECKVTNSDISKCGIACVSFLPGSAGTISKCHIHSTEAIGINVKAGTPAIIENQIEKHAQYGVYIEAGAEPQVIDNTFNENGVTDVFRA
jgi:hypothetical protein